MSHVDSIKQFMPPKAVSKVNGRGISSWGLPAPQACQKHSVFCHSNILIALHFSPGLIVNQAFSSFTATMYSQASEVFVNLIRGSFSFNKRLMRMANLRA